MATDWSEGWHYSLGSDHQGPVSAVRLVQLHLRKKVKPDDQVWHPALEDWCTLREAWPNLRPFRDKAKDANSSTPTRKPTYRVQEVQGLTADAVQEALTQASAEGFVLDHPIPVDATRCLLVFKR